MIAGLEHLKSNLDLANFMQDILIGHVAGGGGITDNDNFYYSQLREYFLSDPELKSFIPKWIRTSRSIDQFGQFIKRKYRTYAERSTFIWSELNGLLEYLESNRSLPSEKKYQRTPPEIRFWQYSPRLEQGTGTHSHRSRGCNNNGSHNIRKRV